jgi:primosomal protein N' (replication factor Y)
LQSRLGRRPVHALISSLRKKGWVAVEVSPPRYRAIKASEPFISLAPAPPPGEAVPPLDRLAERLAGFPEREAPLLRMVRDLALTRGERAKIVKDPRFVLGDREFIREPHFDPIFLEPAPKSLSPGQESALEAILPAIRKETFAPFLLEGVTGSGKTEVYLRAAAETLAAGRGVLVLVPEIGLTPQILGRFRSRFGEQVAVFHSALNPAERMDQWRLVSEGRARVALGARSAVFAPVANLGLVVVDEEQDGAYKQEETPRYNARDVALVRARTAGAVVILGSATPGLESWRNAAEGKYASLRLTQRIGGRAMPTVTVVPAGTGRTLLPAPLRDAVTAEMEAGAKAMILLNRRGFSPAVLCRSCRWLAACPNCSVNLTFHLARKRGVCHYCDHQELLPERCPKCGGADWGYPGLGTERLEEEAVGLWGRERVLRLDRDAATRKGAHQRILREFMAGGPSVLVGTQMIAKGHHLPDVGLMGILGADDLLSLPDFRAAERTFHLLTQAAGRAGRGDRPGRVFVVSDLTDHYVMEAFASGRQETFYAAELEFRRLAGFPPFARLARVLVTGPDAGEAERTATEIAAGLAKAAVPGVTVLGPASPPLARLRNLHRRHLLLRAASHPPLFRALDRAGVGATARGRVAVTVDVDPIDFL